MSEAFNYSSILFIIPPPPPSPRDSQLLSMTLNEIGFKNVCLHGYMKQRERVAALNQFKSNFVRVLIATDVASRGLDIPNVQLVMNHRLPKFPHEYIHRVGRTARAGRDGLAISIFRFPRDLEFLGRIEAAINTKLTELVIDRKCKKISCYPRSFLNPPLYFRTNGRAHLHASQRYETGGGNQVGQQRL